MPCQIGPPVTKPRGLGAIATSVAYGSAEETSGEHRDVEAKHREAEFGWPQYLAAELCAQVYFLTRLCDKKTIRQDLRDSFLWKTIIGIGMGGMLGRLRGGEERRAWLAPWRALSFC